MTAGNGAAILARLAGLRDKAQALADDLAALEQEAREALTVHAQQERAEAAREASGRRGRRMPNPNYQAPSERTNGRSHGAADSSNQPERAARFANLEFE